MSRRELLQAVRVFAFLYHLLDALDFLSKSFALRGGLPASGCFGFQLHFVLAPRFPASGCHFAGIFRGEAERLRVRRGCFHNSLGHAAVAVGSASANPKGFLHSALPPVQQVQFALLALLALIVL